MKKVLGALVALVVVLGGIGIASGLLPGKANDLTGSTTSAADDVKNGAANAVIDASGIKDKVQNALTEKAGAIATATGLSVEQVDAAIADLDVPSWQAATLPSSATETGTASGSYGGVDATLTTYDDPNYVTVDALGQSVTLQVPASAQAYLPYLAYL